MDDPWSILGGDCRALLASLPERSIDVCVTSPPYWGLRDYGVDAQIGLEENPDEYIAELVEVFRGVRRALRDDGTLWLNLGDSYTAGTIGRHDGYRTCSRVPIEGKAVGTAEESRARKRPDGLKPKDLVGIPWRAAFALQADGWYLRSDIIWAKPNPMPESVTDRPTKGHEYVFLLAKSERYFFDAPSIAEPANKIWNSATSSFANPSGRASTLVGNPFHRTRVSPDTNHPDLERGDRNARTVWFIVSEPFAEAHFATFPQELARRCIVAGSPKGGTVLDPFGGAMTTGVVAVKNERRFVGIELNPEYVEIGRRRLEHECPRLLWAMREAAAP